MLVCTSGDQHLPHNVADRLPYGALKLAVSYWARGYGMLQGLYLLHDPFPAS